MSVNFERVVFNGLQNEKQKHLITNYKLNVTTVTVNTVSNLREIKIKKYLKNVINPT
jgi:hypothetical protein